VPVYNVPVLNITLGETITVDRTVLPNIFMGVITTWNDPSLVALQTESVKAKLIAAGDKSITLIVRKDGSGSTEVFTKSLDK
jgi:phosphate transport system substrate-binding protein